MSTLQSHPTVTELSDQLGTTIEQQFDTFCRALFTGPACEQHPGFVHLITGEPHPLGNFAVVADATDASSTAAAIEPLCALEQPSALVFCSAPADDALQIATSRGFALAEKLPAMAVDLDDLTSTQLPDGCSFREVTTADNAAWCDAFAAGYGIPRPVAEYFGPASAARATADIEWRYFVISHDDDFVCTSLVIGEGGLAGIYGVSTLEAHRGKGLAAHATAEPLRLMHQRGYRTGILQSSAMGEPVYRRLGFQDYGAMQLFVRMPEQA